MKVYLFQPSAGAGAVIQGKLEGIGSQYRSFVDGLAWLNFDFGSVWDPVIETHSMFLKDCGDESVFLLTTLYSVLGTYVRDFFERLFEGAV